MKLMPMELERRLRGLKFRLSRKLPDKLPADVWPGIDTAATEPPQRLTTSADTVWVRGGCLVSGSETRASGRDGLTRWPL